MRILLTGAAGFIGFHTARALLNAGHFVSGIDNLNDYYDPALKQARLAQLAGQAQFVFTRLDIVDGPALRQHVVDGGYDRVVHLAAQAGVRYSIEQPNAYVQSNLVGFAHVLEACRQAGIAHLVYASSSSVYGENRSIPFAEQVPADHPVSWYAATKRCNELLAHSYSSLYALPTTGLRLFTAYGPWGRPDMAIYRFTKAILAGQPIKVYNYGEHLRDFTYVADIVEGIARVTQGIATGEGQIEGQSPEPNRCVAPWKIYNLGHGKPVRLEDFIVLLENELGCKARRETLPRQPGDVEATWADCAEFETQFGTLPDTSMEEGIKRFVQWYRGYHGV